MRHDCIVICVPCFNEDQWLLKTLESVRLQSRADFAVLVSDNASTDRTADIASDFAARDHRFHYYRHADNIGAAANFNFAKDASDSPLFVWLGAHDLLHPGFLAYHVARMEADSRLSVSLSAHDVIDDTDRVVMRVEDLPMDSGGPNCVSRYFRSIPANQNNIGINSVIRRAMLDAVGFEPIIGTDRIILSHLAYRGPFASSLDSYYFRRAFDESERGGWDAYMERLTGHPTKAAKDGWRALADAHDRDLHSLIGDGLRQRLLRIRLQLVLRYYLPIDRTSLVTRTLWTLRRLLKLPTKIGEMLR